MSRYRKQHEIDTLIIHCSDTPNGRFHTAADVDYWHGADREKRGLQPFRRHPDALIGAGPWQGLGRHAAELAHIGYHFVIYTNGAVAVGRRLTETGAHARGWNNRSIGVCLIGRDKFTPAQWSALARHVRTTQRHREANHWEKLNVIGHRQVNKRKTCPGFDVQSWLDAGMTPLPGHLFNPS